MPTPVCTCVTAPSTTATSVPELFVPVVAGLYVKRAGAPEALAAMAGGALVTLTLEVGPGVDPWGVPPVLWGLGCSAAALVALLAVRRGRRQAGS